MIVSIHLPIVSVHFAFVTPILPKVDRRVSACLLHLQQKIKDKKGLKVSYFQAFFILLRVGLNVFYARQFRVDTLSRRRRYRRFR